MEALGLDTFDPSAFAPMLDEFPLSGTPVPGAGLPKFYDFEPAPYPEDGPRMSVSETSSLPSRMPAGAQFEVSFLIGIEDGGVNVLMSYVISTGPVPAIADAEELPLIESTEVPEDGQALAFGRPGATVPSELGQVEEVELRACATKAAAPSPRSPSTACPWRVRTSSNPRGTPPARTWSPPSSPPAARRD